MRIALLRPPRKFSFSMDVYADSLVRGLKTTCPDWEFIEFTPSLKVDHNEHKTWKAGIKKYYSRYYSFPKSLKNLEVNLFHIVDHSDGHWVYWLSYFNKASVLTCHDLINLTQPETFQGKAIFPMVSMASWKFSVSGMKKANRVITVSSHTAKDVVKYLDVHPDLIDVIPNAVDSVFSPLPTDTVQRNRSRYGLDRETLCLLNVGSNNQRKNIITILKVLETVRSKSIKVTFWKTGGDFTQEQKEFIRKNSLEDCVYYMGRPSQNELINIYNAADILVAPSLYEGFGLTALEAMACGTPVITSNVTSVPEVVGDAAILTNPLDVDEIVEKVLLIHQDQCKRNDLIQRGIKRVQPFTWERTAEQVATVYEKALACL
ncbi:glycosyltransferase family 4 protein [Romeria aff. gracilis LEGE 07310]|uniref:Glycosyltransferase family 4 protein n=1 Tax=Vasconcelosia minhoensis LEGE 07310 TaxID=915328 RepID=A0A8J7ABT2_9CYAN|nr:glycosyltransferase family 1 protein [Romeria gracilis]MBE9080140.1 glycosyltransferase family 4 protein [Romeria aff. gracilis LEGE 07310]